MIQDLGKRMEVQIQTIQEMFNKVLEELKNKQTEMNNTITEVKNILEGVFQRWRRNKTWRSPSSPQMHQKYIHM